MFNKTLLYVIVFLATTTLAFMAISSYRKHQVEDGLNKIDTLKKEAVVIKAEHEVEVFETNQTITFKKEKEIKDEVVPSSIGIHTISIH